MTTPFNRSWVRSIPSSRPFLSRAVTLAAVFVLLHLAGLRSYTSFLSGTIPGSGAEARWPVFLALMYILAYLAVTVMVPVLVIAAGLLFAARRLAAPRRNGPVGEDLPKRG